MGGGIVGITVNDPSIDDTDTRITPPSVTFGDSNIDMTQMSDGSWVAYVVDHKQSMKFGNEGHSYNMGLSYGVMCDSGLGANNVNAVAGRTESGSGQGDQDFDITTNAVYAQLGKLRDKGNTGACTETQDHQSIGGGISLMSVLEDPPAVNTNSGAGTNNTGQRNMILNSTNNLGAWPFIHAINMSSTQTVAYGGDEVTVEWGDTSGMTDITIDRDLVADNMEIHLTITDPGLNYDPTSEDVWIMDANAGTLYFWNNGTWAADPQVGGTVHEIISRDGNANAVQTTASLGDLGCTSNCLLSVGGSPKKVLAGEDSNYVWSNVTLTETGDNTGVFTTFDDETGAGDLQTATNAAVDSAMTFSYGGDTVSLTVAYHDSTVSFDAGDAWLPVETATYTISDPDMNKNSLDDETLDIGDPHDRIPTIITGSPIHVSDHVTTGGNNCKVGGTDGTNKQNVCISVGKSALIENYYIVSASNTTDTSKRLNLEVNGVETRGGVEGNPDSNVNTITWLNVTTSIAPSELVDLPGSAYVQYDISSIADQLGSTDINAYMAHNPVSVLNGTAHSVDTVIFLVGTGNAKSGIFDMDDTTGDTAAASGTTTVDGAATEKVGVEDTQDVFGSALSSNQVNFMFEITHPSKGNLGANGTCNSQACFGEYAIAIDIVNWDQDNDSDVHNAIYRLAAEETGDNTGVFTGTVEYAILNTALDTTGTGDPSGSSGFTKGGNAGTGSPVSGVPDPAPDFNSDELVILLTSGADGSSAPRVNINDSDTVGGTGDVIGLQIDAVDHSGTAEFDLSSYGSDDTATITITDNDLNQDSSVRETYTNAAETFQIMIDDDDSQIGSDQVIIETSASSGVFVGTFVVPNKLGKDMELQYYDAVDSTGDSSTTYGVASIASNDGSIELDRTSYPVPFNTQDLYDGSNTVMVGDRGSASNGEVVATLTVTDPDNTSDTLTTNSSSEDTFLAGTIKVKISGSFVYTAGSQYAKNASSTAIEELGPLQETAQGSGVYEVDFSIGGSDCHGGSSNSGSCQAGTNEGGKSKIPVNSTSVMQVSYVDTSDAAGGTTTFYDSAIFELHTGTLSVDKDVYVLGQDAVLTLTDLDLNLDDDSAEQYDLRLIEWDSDNNSSVLLHNSYCTSGCTLDPSNLTETGDNTGVFQTVFTIPTSMTEGGTATSSEMGDDVTLTYRDRGLSGETSYGDDSLDIEASFSISKFGAIVELDKAVYDWTDTVYVTITAPDWNQNSNSEETIGTSALAINANTRNGKMCSGTTSYTLNETDENTGVFDGEIALTGFDHTMATSHSYTAPSNACTGNTDGKLQTAGNMDGITVSYEWVDGSIAIASAIIQWNIGVVEFADSSVSPNGSTIIRVTDADEDTDSTIVDTFKVDVFSDSDSGGYQATVSETGEDTGVFEATIYFSDTAATSGLTLRVAEGDTVTAEYTDETLPGPDYTTADDLTVAATTTVGSVTAPLERTPAANARVVDSFGNSVSEVSVDQQVQIAADVANSQSKEQAFAYLVQVQDANGVTVSLAWITGSLNAGQSMSPALSWTPSDSGSYTATVFVWESVDNPVALSPTVSVSIDVV
jgi:hypothetical protein